MKGNDVGAHMMCKAGVAEERPSFQNRAAIGL